MSVNQTRPRGGGGRNAQLSPALLYSSCSINVLISVLAFLGNTLVLVAFIRTPKLRRSHTNYFIVSLAIADLISGCVAVPLWMTVVTGHASSYSKRSSLYLAYHVFDIFANVASIMHLMCISLERYFAIVWPVIHHVANSLTYFITMAVVWVVSITASVVSIEAAVYKEKYVIFNSVTVFGIPLVVIVFSYLSILRTTLRRSSVRKTRNLDRELKVAMTVFILVALFIITWCPFFTIALVSLHCRGCVSMSVILFLKCLHYSNAFCNPIVYAARIPDFRMAFQNLLPKNLFVMLSCHLDDPRNSPTTTRDRSCSAMSMPDSATPKQHRQKLGLLDEKNVTLHPLANHDSGESMCSGQITPGITNCSLSTSTFLNSPV